MSSCKHFQAKVRLLRTLYNRVGWFLASITTLVVYLPQPRWICRLGSYVSAIDLPTVLYILHKIILQRKYAAINDSWQHFLSFPLPFQRSYDSNISDYISLYDLYRSSDLGEPRPLGSPCCDITQILSISKTHPSNITYLTILQRKLTLM